MSDYLAKRVLSLATAQAADSDARCVALDHLLAAFPSQLEIESALDDAEEVLRLHILMSRNTSIKPPHGAMHGLGHALMIWRGRCNDIVQLHDNVTANTILE